ncbi:MAG TPA: lamin tail domain-containing protein [Kofleriaceae bacterium]|nr:lamin tail domain-containing protein [Kofleriaceae bacterium]
MVNDVGSWRTILIVAAGMAAACGGGGGDRADGGPDHDARPRYDADPNAGFDHFRFEIAPAVPLATRDMTIRVVAYGSPDEASVLGYDSTVSVTASVGTLSGAVSQQPLERGQAELVVQLDTPADQVTFTVTDDSNPNITGTSPPVRVAPPGDQASERAVVINEVNWYGSGADIADEWIELRNLSGGPLQLSEWTIDRAGAGDAAVQIANGTELAAGGYLLLAAKRGPDRDGERTSLSGVAGVQLLPIALTNTGEELVLRDPDGTVIDATPAGAWPAGNNVRDYSMERRDDQTGGGYGDGAAASSWYTWSLLDGGDTTSADTVDRGTPGAANSDPDLFDHFTIAVAPSPPRAGVDFTMTVTAYSSSDDSQVISSYDGSISVSASAGTLGGEDSNQPIQDGVASLTLQNDTPNPSVTLTVRDDFYPDITGSIDVEIRPVGDTAGPRDVVMSEVNWYGNGVTAEDEWIELHNTSGAELNVSGWTIAGAGTGSAVATLDSGTLLGPGEFLVVGELQGADVPGQRTSLTGVAGVQLAPLSLTNTPGEQLVLRDIDGNLIDETPAAGWPAGDSGRLRSMERRDDVTGGGYTDGSQAGAWYTWNRADGRDTTHPDSLDHGTPGARNSDPAAFFPPLALPYATSFEDGEPAWENNAITGVFSTTPPAGTAARTGARTVSTDSMTTNPTAREVRSIDCIALDNDSDPLQVSAWGTASTANGGNVVRGRIAVLWYLEQTCTTPHGTTPVGNAPSVILSQGSYTEMTYAPVPPAGATHVKIWVQVFDTNGTPNNGDDWAADDVSAAQ